MFTPLLLVLSPMAAVQEPPATAADVGRCIDAEVEKRATSSDSAAVVADRVVMACEGLIGQWSAARDALVAKEAGPVPPSNSAEFRKAATEGFRQAALLTVERARRTR